MANLQQEVSGTVDVLVSPQHLQAIGHVAAQWSFLEDLICLTICGFLGVPQRTGRAITSQHGARTLIHMANSLAKEVLSSKTDQKRFAALTKRIESLSVDRNNVVHALWGRIDDDIAFRVKFTGWGEVKFVNAKMTAADIETIASNISRVSCDLHVFMLDFGLAPTD